MPVGASSEAIRITAGVTSLGWRIGSGLSGFTSTPGMVPISRVSAAGASVFTRMFLDRPSDCKHVHDAQHAHFCRTVVCLPEISEYSRG